MRPYFLILCGLFALAPAAHAQVVTASPQVAVYRYAVPGQPTMDVRVWGNVRTPGTYQVELDQDLIGVLTMAGGPVYDRERGGEERSVSVRISRGSESVRTVVYEAPLEELFGSQSDYPALQDGDIVTVDTEYEQTFGWRDAATIFSSVGTVAVIILNIIRLSN